MSNTAGSARVQERERPVFSERPRYIPVVKLTGPEGTGGFSRPEVKIELALRDHETMDVVGVIPNPYTSLNTAALKIGAGTTGIRQSPGIKLQLTHNVFLNSAHRTQEPRDRKQAIVVSRKVIDINAHALQVSYLPPLAPIIHYQIYVAETSQDSLIELNDQSRLLATVEGNERIGADYILRLASCRELTIYGNRMGVLRQWYPKGHQTFAENRRTYRYPTDVPLKQGDQLKFADFGYGAEVSINRLEADDFTIRHALPDTLSHYPSA